MDAGPSVYYKRVALNTTNQHKTHHKPNQPTTNQTTKPLKPKLIVGNTCSDLNWGRKCAGRVPGCRNYMSTLKKIHVHVEILPFLHVYSAKSYNFYIFSLDPNMFQIIQIKITYFLFLRKKIEVSFILIFSSLRP